MVHCALPPWRLILLEGMVASEASYPAWPVTEKSRPKALVFFIPKRSLDGGHAVLCTLPLTPRPQPPSSCMRNAP